MGKSIILFDVDGTLAVSTQQVADDMCQLIERIHGQGQYRMGIVGGGSYQKICQQLGSERLIRCFDYIFSENGVVAHQIKESGVELINNEDIREVWSESLTSRIIRELLQLVIDTPLPFHRGQFITFRRGMIYFTPCGSDCSWDERLAFAEYDRQHGVRDKAIRHVIERFRGDDVDVKNGGMIGIGIHPLGWDKTHALKFLDGYRPESIGNERIYYFGDRYLPDGNDYELLHHPWVIGYPVDGPSDTIRILSNEFLIMDN